jgi:hypothetical protein
MQQENHDHSLVSRDTPATFRRPLLRAIAGGGALGVLGVPHLAGPARATIPGVEIDYKRCRVAFVTNASAIDAIAVYYADRDGDRNARYDIAPTSTDPRGYAPLVVEYDADEDRTQIQLTEPRGSLVCVIAEAGSDRTVATNPTDACVPAGFNVAPSASFGVSVDPTVGEPVTFSSTASDTDSPDRLFYAWDLDGDGVFETSGETATTTFSTPGQKPIRHRVTDDCGASDTAQATVSVEPQPSTAAYPTEQVATLVPSTPRVFFGQRLAIDGDTVVAGSTLDNNDRGDNTGAAYVFTRSGDTWTQQAKLTPLDGAPGDRFGESVSVDGDTVLVGTSLKENAAGTPGAGAAYVFTRTGDTWTQQAKLEIDGAESGARFGSAVSLEGDTALVGAAFEDGGGFNNGAVYVFTRSGTTWTQRARLVAADGRSSRLGVRLALDGGTALVGSVGAAYVFTGSGATWTQQAKLVSSTTRGEFGVRVALDGETAVVGEPLADLAGNNSGAAYVFTRTGDTWTQQTKLTATDAAAEDRFGISVAVQGDVALIGATGQDVDGVDNTGAVYVFTRDETTWTQRPSLVATDRRSGASLGIASAVDRGTWVVGSTVAQTYVFE